MWGGYPPLGSEANPYNLLEVYANRNEPNLN